MYIFSYPGIRSGDLDRALKEEILPSPSEIGIVIIHVGTNDASTTRKDQSEIAVADDISELCQTVRKMYNNVEIMFSSILPRFDEDHGRTITINKVSNF